MPLEIPIFRTHTTNQSNSPQDKINYLMLVDEGGESRICCSTPELYRLSLAELLVNSPLSTNNGLLSQKAAYTLLIRVEIHPKK